ncbi:hypothetical protein Belba_3637 [Belliella baltica DSM 15883]|uniref:CHAD domain-containing protein n=1 Tax=Belliella baltica (strain DSM 15883 / CIP 108006 / LMG 21964 / BA134) TaxID=866536 RepID=I3ZA61_BELBD|nr:hypothetical protein [Belliella baltica]AFL86129.1 hypothetical protein Belba_3637 [Belliella baltica DSM 15883]
MKGKISPIFRLFDSQYEEAKNAFLILGRQYKGKKAVELEQKLIFLEIYVDLISKIHFEERKLKFEVFKPFKEIFKGLKKTKHLKLVLEELNKVKLKNKLTYNSYEKFLLDEKKDHYNKIYDLILSTPLEKWEKFYENVYKNSLALQPLMVNTATTQIINEELEFFNLEHQTKLDNKALKDIYEGLRVIIALENIRIESGLNAIFVEEVHEKMKELQTSLLSWYQNQLFTQHLVYFFSEKDEISKKYKDLLKDLKADKKIFTMSVEKQCKNLFSKILWV